MIGVNRVKTAGRGLLRHPGRPGDARRRRHPARHRTEHKANALVGQVVRFLDDRGLYQSFGGQGDRPQPAPAFLFGALPLELSGLAENPLYGLQIRQAHLDRCWRSGLSTSAWTCGAGTGYGS